MTVKPLKILAISAHHPPCHFGGYELRIRDILDRLSANGHAVRVLTNKPEKDTSSEDSSQYPVIRKLHNRRRARFFPLELLYDLLDIALLAREIKRFQPDMIYLGHTYILSKALLPYLARLDIPIVYDEGGAGLVEAWTEHGRWFRFCGDYSTGSPLLDALKGPVIQLVCGLSRGRIQPQWQWPQNMRVIFNSDLNHRNAASAGVPVENAGVIHSGVDTSRFTFKERSGFASPLQIIVPGRIERRKGQKDAVELLDNLLQAGIDARLVLAGVRWTDGYYEEVTGMIQTLGLGELVEILSMLSSAELVEQYHQADICFFPSYHRTGFSRVPLEAMACGCIVITYGNEGSDEVVKDGHNGHIIDPQGYTQALALVHRLQENPFPVLNLIQSAYQSILTDYSTSNYIDRIEKTLLSI